MAAHVPAPPMYVERRRYVKIPETTAVQELRDLYADESADLDPIAMCSSLLLAAHRLTIGRFKVRHWYASIVSDQAAKRGGPNALSGWGHTPDQALRELSFRWEILLQGSWDTTRWNLKALPIWTTTTGDANDVR